MGHDSDHDDHGHGKYPGPHTHQAGWVMYMTIAACVAFAVVIVTLKLI